MDPDRTESPPLHGTHVDTRFGPISLAPAQRWRCAEPLPGFEESREFALLHVAEQGPFLWLQSLERAELVFLLVDAARFGLHYEGVVAGDAPVCLMVIVPRAAGEVLRLHKQAPLLFDLDGSSFVQQVFEPEQVLGDGVWIDQPTHEPAVAWTQRIVEVARSGA
jgi:flagellar assembly factor FliW